MQEISLNILDIVENSVAAGASEIRIFVDEDTGSNRLSVTVEDDGKGMSPEQLKSVTDPFYTTRTTRRVGLGVPLFKMHCEMTGGSFSISSEPGKGTRVNAVFNTSHIDAMPLGNIDETIFIIVTQHKNINIVYERTKDSGKFHLDTKELRAILGDISFKEPEIALFIKNYIRENSPT
jgi:anti-sigma regulatory factor (Ser/Thr protein kinase)